MDYKNVLLYDLAFIRRSFKGLVYCRCQKHVYFYYSLNHQPVPEKYFGVMKSFIFISKGNVSLGNACVFYDQCLGSPNASCLDGICNCIRGYVPIRTDNSSKCIQSMNLACL